MGVHEEEEEGQRRSSGSINGDATIENPLRHLSESQLMRDVERFCQRMGLEEIEADVKRGAIIAQYPTFYEQVARGNIDVIQRLVPPLRDSEMRALRNEKDALFKQSRDLYITIISCASAALVQGWDQTGSNGANLTWPIVFGLGTPPHLSTRSDWIVGAVNAAPYFAAALIGCLLTDPINSHFGRRGTIFFAAMWCFASVVGSAFTNSWQALFAARLCLGIGMGTKASTVPVFAAESAPAYFRGSMVLSWQFWVASGILLGFSANLVVINTGLNLAWRLQLGSALLPAIPLLILIYIAPESPRWHMKKNTSEHYQKAYESLKRLRNTNLQACRDLYLAHKELEVEQYLANRSRGDGPQNQVMGYAGRFIELFTVRRIRRATLAAFTVMLAQQLCGINVLAFYSSTLFSHTTGTRGALLYSWAFGFVNTAFAIPAVRSIDIFGRRNLLLCSVFCMIWLLLIAGLCFKIPKESSARTPLIAIFLFLFAAAYSPGQGPVPFIYSAEAFPLSHREVGMSFSVAINLFFAGLLTITFLRVNDALGDTGSLGLFAGFNALAFMMIYLWVPETARRTLEGLTQVFEVRTRVHMRYQLTEYLPYFVHRYLLCGGRETVLRDLYYEAPEVYDQEEKTENVDAVAEPNSPTKQPYSAGVETVENVTLPAPAPAIVSVPVIRPGAKEFQSEYD